MNLLWVLLWVLGSVAGSSRPERRGKVEYNFRSEREATIEVHGVAGYVAERFISSSRLRSKLLTELGLPTQLWNRSSKAPKATPIRQGAVSSQDSSRHADLKGLI